MLRYQICLGRVIGKSGKPPSALRSSFTASRTDIATSGDGGDIKCCFIQSLSIRCCFFCEALEGRETDDGVVRRGNWHRR